MRAMMKAGALLAMVCFALGGTASGAPGAAAGGQPFNGSFTNTFDVGPACPDSPILTCSHGLLYDERGVFVGAYEFSFDSQTPNLTDPTLVSFTGRSVITKTKAPTGVLYGEDHGQLRIDPLTQTGSFTTYVEIVGGTGSYSGATGLLVAMGRVDLTTGTGGGTYRGSVNPSGP